MKNLLIYFFKLGSLGFGGPLVLVEKMNRDLVETKKWISPDEFLEGLAFSKLFPGPLSTQLAIYLGWLRFGIRGATAVAFAFTLPSFLIILGLAYLYVRYGSLPWIQNPLYAMNAAIVGIIVKSTVQITRRTFGKDRLLWLLFLVSATVSIWQNAEVLGLFLISGAIAVMFKAPPSFTRMRMISFFTPVIFGSAKLASLPILAHLLITFFKAGSIVFGSGLAILPFMRQEVVLQNHWLTEQQFLDAISAGMITPGPIVIASAFIGYLVAGPLGSIFSAFGIFLPVYLFVVLLGPHYRRMAKNPQINAFIQGITASAIGGIAGGAWILGKRAIVDLPTLGIATLGGVLLLGSRKIQEPLVIFLAATLGILLKNS